MPIVILPIETDVEVDFDNKAITVVESPVKNYKEIKIVKYLK